MRTLILLGALIVSTAAMSPDSWKVTLNNKALLLTSAENPEKNKIIIASKELLKKGPLVISYIDKRLQKGWKREISVVDSGENDLVKRGNSKVTITTGEVRKILDKGINTIHVYSWSLPTDPNKAAVIRVRRVHLCTIIIS